MPDLQNHCKNFEGTSEKKEWPRISSKINNTPIKQNITTPLGKRSLSIKSKIRQRFPNVKQNIDKQTHQLLIRDLKISLRVRSGMSHS